MLLSHRCLVIHGISTRSDFPPAVIIAAARVATADVMGHPFQQMKFSLLYVVSSCLF